MALAALPVLAVTAGLIGLLFFVPGLNDLQVRRLAEKQRQEPMPAGVALVEVTGVCENTGSGNHIEFVIETVVRSARPPDELKAAFGAVAVTPYAQEPEDADGPPCWVVTQVFDGALQWDIRGH